MSLSNKKKYNSAVFVVDLKGTALTREQREAIEEEIKEVIRRNINRVNSNRFLLLNEDLLINDKFYNLSPRIVGIWLDELKVNVFKKLVKIRNKIRL